MDEKKYPNNSNASNREKQEERLKPVVAANMKERKSLINPDWVKGTAKDIGRFAWDEVLVPTFKKTLYDLINGSAQMALMDGRKPTTSQNGDRYSTKRKTSVVNSFDSEWGGNSAPKTASPIRYGENYVVSGIPDMNKFNELLRAIDNVIERYGSITLSQIYELTHADDAPPPPYTYNNYGYLKIDGWTRKLNTFSGTFDLVLPPVEPLKR